MIAPRTDDNFIERTIPETLTQALVNLTTLNLRNNKLAGDLPSQWACPKLTYLDFSRNQLTGPIPRQLLANCTRLDTLIASYNRLNKELPNDEGVWNCTKLRVLRLESNRFTGEIPRLIFTQCPSLEEVRLCNNGFIGELPKTVGRCKNLRELDVHTNYLEGYVPATALRDCNQLMLLNLMHQAGAEPMAMPVDGSKAQLISAMPDGCVFFWPGDENDPGAVSKRGERLGDLKKELQRAEKGLERTRENKKLAQEAASRSEDTLRQTTEHCAKVTAQRDEKRKAHLVATESIKTARANLHDAKAHLSRYEQAVLSVMQKSELVQHQS